MTTHLIRPWSRVTDIRMRCGAAIDDVEHIGSEDGIGEIDCAGCLRDLVIELRARALGVQRTDDLTPEHRWLVSGDTGTSSLTIWSVMTSRPMPDGRTPSVPLDPDDFGRCHRLLELFPAWRARMPEVAAAHPAWAGLVGAWEELTALYLEELPTGSAPRLYERMERLRQ